MNKEQMEYFKILLNQRLSDLLRNADSAVSELVSESTQEIEYIDKASAHTHQELKLKIRSRESRLINKIRNALERIDNGTYGICELCGEDISIRRLEARPVTTKCIECKEEEEQMEHILEL